MQETEYGNLYSSRTVVKNQYDTGPTASRNWYGGTDIWGEVNTELKNKLEAGITIYGEIVGYASENKFIQKGYDYDCKPGEHEFYAYRITMTNVDGDTYEFPWEEVKEYCVRKQIKHVPDIGRINPMMLKADYFSIGSSVTDEILKIISAAWMNKTLPNGMPDEGICVRQDFGLRTQIFKLKNSKFLQHETKMLDEGEDDMEATEVANAEEVQLV